MNNDVELEGRPRPLSTGLWTLFSWLRRDYRSDSSESISSAGSDRTVASFAFLTPANYQPPTTTFILPPLGPPTDSYKKRVHDRNIRRQYDRDITLHRKYGLFKSGDATCIYDTFSLPPARRINENPSGRWDRDRRATSECFQRRSVHVPGKRRAPLPPVPESLSAPTTSLTRRNTRKRRAPPPPVKLVDKDKENINNVQVKTIITQMNPQADHDDKKKRNHDVSMGCKSEKYSKKEECAKDIKVKHEKNFLKQIFDGKKRNSGIDILPVKLLPSISELDKQAAEIIENYKLNASEQNTTLIENKNAQNLATWTCTNCSRKYNSPLIICLYCSPNKKMNPSEKTNEVLSSTSKASNSYTQTETKITSNVQHTAEDKQKLKEMLKEMKDSLPKQTNHNLNIKKKNRIVVDRDACGNIPCLTETPTLRVGCTVQNENNTNKTSPPKELARVSLKSALQEECAASQKQTLVSNQPASIAPVKQNNIEKLSITGASVSNKANLIQRPPQTNLPQIHNVEILKIKNDLNTPLKISSLLNPVYIPKNSETNKFVIEKQQQAASKVDKQKSIGAKTDSPHGIPQKICSPKTSVSSPGPSTSHIIKTILKDEVKRNIEVKNPKQQELLPQKDNLPTLKEQNSVSKIKHDIPPISGKEKKISNDITMLNQHSRRRDLINQLEQSIAKGDELAAAEAAAKLAQLRLSCSVLSFSSQILAEPSTSSAIVSEKIDSNKLLANIDVPDQEAKKELQKIQLSSAKEKIPLNSTISNKTSTTSDVKNNWIVSSSSNSGSPKDKSQLNSQESIIKKIILHGTQSNNNSKKENEAMVTISALVEDREATRGPVQLRIRRQALMRDLRQEAETSLGLATNMQRWIVGRALCVNDNTPVISLAGPDFNAPFYLCVVESEKKADPILQTQHKPILDSKVTVDKTSYNNKSQPKTGDVYKELVQLEQQALVPNAENFECGVCMENYLPGSGVVLRECVHIFCKDCLADVVRHCEEPDIPCPAMGCRGMLQEREIRALVTQQDYERWLARGLAAAESGTRNAFHCRTRDCKGWALCEPGVQRFPCPVCKNINCVPCQAIHDGETCEEHRLKQKQAAASSNKSFKPGETDDGTRTLLNSLIAKGEALECPECSAVITKKWGCDWVKCSACKTEICWVTRGRRWGPGGKGDTSGGCRCGVDGKRCHPSCGYCH